MGLWPAPNLGRLSRIRILANSLGVSSEKNAATELVKKMKTVILAGGLGTRISEETHLRPKPMLEIGGRPILWHIMKLYAHHGVSDFIICCGYKGHIIKEYFANYHLHNSDVTFDTAKNEVTYHQTRSESWRVTLIDTGADTMTGGRLKRVREHLGDEDFCFTYGDGVSDLNIRALIEFHNSHGGPATVTAVQPPGRYGALALDGSRVERFIEKPMGDGGYINGGFFVLSPSVIDLIEDDTTSWEGGPLETLAHNKQLQAFQHNGFWRPMDTLRDKQQLEHLWSTGKAPWKQWA
jgi:glucose-1-phosphate cytidylyltransferase